MDQFLNFGYDKHNNFAIKIKPRVCFPQGLMALIACTNDQINCQKTPQLKFQVFWCQLLLFQ